MLNGASEAEAWPSLTLITMLKNAPTLALEGVPLKVPVEVLKPAQEGLFCTLKVSVMPVGPLAVGVNEYACPALTCVGGVPPMVGAGGGEAATTWMLNAGRAADAEPSLTLIAMLEKVPVFGGVPLKVPVEVLKVAQDGRFCTVKVSVAPAGPLAIGVKE
jgi:hypothetical protein